MKIILINKIYIINFNPLYLIFNKIKLKHLLNLHNTLNKVIIFQYQKLLKIEVFSYKNINYIISKLIAKNLINYYLAAIAGCKII